MSSHKGKVSLTSLANVTDLSDLDGFGDGLAGLDGLDSLEAMDAPEGPDPDDPIGELDYESLTNEAVAVKETSAVLQAFIARSKAEQARFLLAADSEYWGAVFSDPGAEGAFLARGQAAAGG